MLYIGIITNQKNEMYIKKELMSISGIKTNYSIIFINEKNIDNLQAIKFEIILLDIEIKSKKREIREKLLNSNFLVLNNDRVIDKSILENIKIPVITYGFNSKSTFTISSIEENSLIICLQRIIFNKNNNIIEPQEYKVKNSENTEKYAIIGTEILKIIYK
jgi:hypothetical protein